MRKKIFAVMTVSVMLALAGCQGGTDSDAPVATPTQTVQPAETEAPEPTATMALQETSTPTPEPTTTPILTPEPVVEVYGELYDYTFELDGVAYQLPMTYQTLVASGWKLYENHDENMELSGYAHYSLLFFKGDESIYFDVVNMSGHATEVKDCIIGGISVSDDVDMTFSIVGDVDFDITQDEVKEVFGTPDSEGTNTVKYKESSYKSVSFYFFNDDLSCSSIEIRYFEAIGDGITVVSEERPAYLEEYVAPTELGDDTTVTVFELDGMLYQLPCPLDVFLNNGWEFASKDMDSMGSGNSHYSVAYIKKGDVKLEIGLINYGKKEVYLEHCCIYRIYFGERQLMDAADGFLKLPAGITGKSTEEEVKAACVGFEEYNASSFDKYTYDDNPKKIQWIFNEGKEVGSLDISNTNWDY